MNSKPKKNTKFIIIISVILFIGFLFFDIFSILGADFLTCLYLVLAIPILLVLIVVSLIFLFLNKSFNLRGVIPLISTITVILIMSIILCITPGNIASHEVSLYYFSRELYNCPLPTSSEIIIKGSKHGNSSGTSNHCENFVYMVISSDKSVEEIKSFYESKLSNRIDKGSLDIRLLNKEDEYISTTIYSFTEEQRSQLTKVEKQKKVIYLISALKRNSPTCLAGH